MTPPRVSFFGSHPALFTPRSPQYVPGLRQRLRYMGADTLELLLWRAPFRDTTYTGWERNWEQLAGSQIDWCAKNGHDYIARLDDGFNTITEHAALLRWPQAIQHVARRTRDSGRCVGVEIKDEMAPDPRLYPNLLTFASLWRNAGGPPLACPSYSTHQYARVPGLTGYHSCQWIWEVCRTYQDHESRMLASMAGLPRDRPTCMMVPVSRMYRKFAPGDTFTPGKDRWTYRGLTVPQLKRLISRALAEGVSQFRLYMLETAQQQAARGSARIGEPRCQIGAGQTDPRWSDLELAVRGLGRKEKVPAQGA